MKPPRLYWLLMVVLLLCSAYAGTESAQFGVELRATVGERVTTTGLKRVLILTVSNRTSKQVVIAKPALPSSWLVDKTTMKSGVAETEQLHGGIGRGQPDPGGKTRYRADQYARLEPGAVFNYVTDLDFYLSSGLSEPSPGRYTAVFQYEYVAASDEADLPLVDCNS